jgi:multidrug efflux pump subunit AcrA (membrane-fusion protein)
VVKRRVRRRAAPVARRRAAPLTVLLALLAAGAVVAAVLVVGGGTPAVQVSERTATVTRGVIQTIVSGSGNLSPLAQQDVDFATSGKVTRIYVHTGERVGKGDLIARLDASTQKVAVDKAEADLTDAEDALTKAEEAAATATATPQTTAAAEATTVAVAAQAAPTPTGTPERPTPTPTPATTPTPSATAAPAQPSGSATQSGGGSTQSVASAEAAVESDQLALKQAQDDLAATVLRAPMAGTVASINGAVGDTTSGNGSSSSLAAASSTADSSSSSGFVVLADLKRLKMSVSLSESDIAKVHKGQPATVTINAASGEKVAAHVTSVGVLSSSSGSTSGAVSYPVEVTLDQTTQGVKAGMSATADIVVAQSSGLMVPSQALRGGSVTVVRGGRRSTRQVQTGVVGDTDTQILSGLQAGDQVIVTSTAATLGAASQASGSSGAGGFRGLGGGGAFPGGGGFAPGGGGFAPGGGGGAFRFRAGG